MAEQDERVLFLLHKARIVQEDLLLCCIGFAKLFKIAPPPPLSSSNLDREKKPPWLPPLAEVESGISFPWQQSANFVQSPFFPPCNAESFWTHTQHIVQLNMKGTK